MYIKPDPEFAWVARNPRQGNRLNPPPDLDFNDLVQIALGTAKLEETIEVEVHTVPGIVEHYFTPGTRVLIEGWWVEDATHPKDVGPFHSPFPPVKTELHPIRYMLTRPPGQGEKWVIYMAQDFSGRFEAGGWDHAQYFHFGMPNKDTVEGDKPTATSDAAVLIESSLLDLFSEGDHRSGYTLSWAQVPDQPEFIVEVLQHPWSYRNWPFYFAQIERTSKPVYEDGVIYSVKTDSSGKKYVEISVNANLLGTGTNQNLYVSYWVVEKGPNEEPERQTILNSPHAFNFTRQYGPAIGKTATSWTLQTTASSLGVYVPPNTVEQGGGPSMRVSVLKQREYKITPSWVELQIGGSRQTNTRAELQGKEGPAIDFLPDLMYCQDDASVTAVEHLLPQIQAVPETLGWSVRVAKVVPRVRAVVDDHLRPVLAAQGSPWIAVTRDVPFENDVAKVTVDPANDHRLNLQWKQWGYLDVRARMDTDLGEKVEAVQTVRKFCAFSATGGLDEFFESIYKGLMAIEKLQKLGFLRDPIPSDFSRKVKKVPFASLEDPSKLVNKLSGPYRDVLGGFLKLVDDQPLTIREWNLLNRFAAGSSRIRWNTPAPAGVFQKMATAGALRRSPQEPARPVIRQPRAKYPAAVVIPWGSDSILAAPLKPKNPSQ